MQVAALRGSGPPLAMNTPLRYLFVAGLGRQTIGPRETVRAAVTAVLKSLEAYVPDAQPVALASAAAGADQVFLEAADALGWPIRMVLPTPAHVFAKDFTRTKEGSQPETDAAGLAAFHALYGKAIDVEVLPPVAGRYEAFARTADELVRRADVAVVLWDGLPGKTAGTNETLDFAIKAKKLVVLLDAETGQPRPEVAPPTPDELMAVVKTRNDAGILRDIAEALKKAPLKNGRTAFQRMEAAAAAAKAAADAESAAPGKAHAQPVDPGAPETSQLEIETLESVLEDVLKIGARHMSDEHRKDNKRVLSLHILATAVGLVGLAFFTTDSSAAGSHTHGWSHAISILKLGLVAYAFYLIRCVQQQRKNLDWSRARYVREIGRSLSRTAAVTALLRESVGAFVPPSIWVVFHRLRLPLTTFYAKGRPRLAKLKLAEVITAYRQAALHPEKQPTGLSQYLYFSNEHRKAHDELHTLHRRVRLCLALMVLAAAVSLILSLSEAPHFATMTAKFFSVFLPVLAATWLVLPNLNDWNRRDTVYRSIAERLRELDGRLVELQQLLVEPAVVTNQAVYGVKVWCEEVAGKATEPEEARQAKVRAAVEAMVANRFAAIVVETEATVLTELIGFKTFVESVEVG